MSSYRAEYTLISDVYLIEVLEGDTIGSIY
jgi:hypothetical protein